MPIQYDIQTDELYLEGLERGMEKGLEKGMELHRRESVIRMLKVNALTVEQIADFAGISVQYVLQIKEELQKQQ